MIVFDFFCTYRGVSGPSLLIESTDSMMIKRHLIRTLVDAYVLVLQSLRLAVGVYFISRAARLE